jgi:nicotinamide-nucleotide amidase
MFPPDIHDLARRLIEDCAAGKKRVATAESCTGGLIAAALTEIAGSSAVFEYGFATYSDKAKSEMLGVPPELIERHGAVSAEVAEHMAEGARERARADFAVSATGIAGPGGGSAAKPVGLVYIGLAQGHGSVFHYKCFFKGDRSDVRMQTVKEALKLLSSLAGERD